MADNFFFNHFFSLNDPYGDPYNLDLENDLTEIHILYFLSVCYDLMEKHCSVLLI